MSVIRAAKGVRVQDFAAGDQVVHKCAVHGVPRPVGIDDIEGAKPPRCEDNGDQNAPPPRFPGSRAHGRAPGFMLCGKLWLGDDHVFELEFRLTTAVRQRDGPPYYGSAWRGLSSHT